MGGEYLKRLDENMHKFKKINGLLVNILVFCIGFIMTLISVIFNSIGVLSSFLLSVGTSLIASSIVVFITSFYLLEQNRLKQIIEDWGLDGIYRTRAEMNPYSNEMLKMENKKIDIIAFGLKSFRDSQGDLLRSKVREGVKIRIITINPSSKFLAERERCEKEKKGQIKKTINDLIEFIGELKKIEKDKGQVEIRVYDSLPLDFYFGYKNQVFTGPYMYDMGSQQTISYSYKAKSYGFKYFSEYFEKLWNDSEFTKGTD